MNNFKTTYPGKMPLWLDDIRFIIEMFKPFVNQLAIAVSKTDNMVLTGCTENSSGNLFTISSGYALINGELCYFPGGSITLESGEYSILVIEETIDPAGARTFGDGTLRNDIYIIRRAKLSKINETVDDWCYVSAAGLPLVRRIYEPSIGAKGTAFNKNFGISAGMIPDIGSYLSTNSVLQTDGAGKLATFSQLSAHNKNFGAGENDIPRGNHNHDTAYAAAGHNHDSAYSAINHNHDSAYSAYGHNHDSVYAALWHNHDSDYYKKAQFGETGDAAIHYTRITGLRTKIVEIEAWDMNADPSKIIDISALNLDLDKIINVEAIITNDEDEAIRGKTKIEFNNGGTSSISYPDNGNKLVVLTRTGGGIYDGTQYDNATMNRGHIIITHTDQL